MRPKNRTRISYVIKDEYGDRHPHCAGINALALDETTPTESDGQAGGILFTAGRDSVVNSWDCHIDFARHQRLVEEREWRERERELRLERDRSDGYLLPPTSVGVMTPRDSLSRSNARRSRTHASFKVPPFSPRHSAVAFSDDLSSQHSISGPDHSASYPVNASGNSNISDMPLSSSPPQSPRSPTSPTGSGDLYRVNGSRRPESDRFSVHAQHHATLDTPRDGPFSSRDKRSITFNGQAPLHSPMSSAQVRRSESLISVERPSRLSRILSHPTPPSTLRRSYQHHSDWVNDVVLCNNNQHIISASNDRTIYLNSTVTKSDPMLIGHHQDYVKCLAYAKQGSWVASGGLDHRVLKWDVEEGRGHHVGEMAVSEHAETLLETASPKASIYALGCNASGSILASGGPDKAIRVWDFRANRQVMRLQGHSENVRALIISDDGARILSASCDSTVKLWHLSKPHRPMHTYSHFEDSVYCLYSTHPDLDTFWTGGRDGWVTKVSRSKTVDTSDDLLEVVAVCKEDSPVHKLVAINDMYIWTATAKAQVNRWRDIPFQHVDFAESAKVYDTGDEGRVIIPKTSMLTIPNSKALDEASTTHSFRPFSVFYGERMSTVHRRKGTSIYALSTDIGRGDADERPPVEPAWREPDGTIAGTPGLVKCVVLNNRRHVVTQSAVGVVVLWDIIRCVKLKEFPGEFQEVVDAYNTTDWIPPWCSIDIHSGFLVVHLDESTLLDAEVYRDECGVAGASRDSDHKVNLGRWILTLLFEKFIDATLAPEKVVRGSANELLEEEASTEETFAAPVPVKPLRVQSEQWPDASPMLSPLILEAKTDDLPPVSPALTLDDGDDSIGPTLRAEESSSSSGGCTPSSSQVDFSAEPGSANTKPRKNSLVFTIPPPPDTIPPPEAFSAASSLSSLLPIPPAVWNEPPPTEPDTTSHKPTSDHSESAGDSRAEPIPATPDPDGRSTPPSRPASPPQGDKTPSFMDKLKSQVRRRPSSTRSDELLGDTLADKREKRKQEKERGKLGVFKLSVYGDAKVASEAPPSVINDTERTMVPSGSSTRRSRGSNVRLPLTPRKAGPPRTYINEVETPIILVPSAVPVIVSIEESHEAAAFLDAYRAPVGRMGSSLNVERLNAILPLGILDLLLKNKMPPSREIAKITFLLEPAVGSGLPPLPGG
ncbi:hypothetical protein HKX48_001070, partial [Thoreauomyces humboldtii]